MAVKITIPKIPPSLDSSDVNTNAMLLTNEKEKIDIQTKINAVITKFYRTSRYLSIKSAPCLTSIL